MARRCCGARSPIEKDFQQPQRVGHRSLGARMRPIAAPDEVFRIGVEQGVVKWLGFDVVRRSRAQPIGAGNLRPQPAFADASQQRLEAAILRAVAMLHPAHVIDHDRYRHARQRARKLRQVARVDPQLQMPAELGHDAVERLDVGKPYAVVVVGLAVAAELVGAQAAHASRRAIASGFRGVNSAPPTATPRKRAARGQARRASAALSRP